jgi:hypothetical protein
MLRLGILSSVIPLVLVGGVSYEWTGASARPCIGLAVQSSSAITFASDGARATVKVQIVDAAELADLVIADEAGTTEPDGCGLQQLAQSMTIGAKPVPGAPVVYLSRESGADYRIYVDSPTISARQAAAMIVAARGGHTLLAAQPLDLESTGSISR